jgi:plastocyanin
MGRSARQLWTLLLGAACLLSSASAIAVATPAHSSTPRRGAFGARWCARHPHASRRARRARRCHAPQRSSTQTRSAAPGRPGASGSPSTGGTAPTAPSAGSSSPASGSSPGPAQPGEAPPTPPPSVPHVQITAVEYSFTLSRTTVPAGKVILELVNQGQDEHNLNVLPAEGSLAGAFADTPSKGISDQQLILRAGSYTLFCSLPEHKQRGMKATLLVE